MSNELKVDLPRGVISDEFQCPPIYTLLELSKFGLIDIDSASIAGSQNHYVLLMQELRTAVENDFAVSDYFLTFNAVGTIINASEGSSVTIPSLQSAASIHGSIEQTQIITPAEIAQKLIEILGQGTLNAAPDLNKAIQEFAQVSEEKQHLQLGKVILELGRLMEHGSNFAGTIATIAFISRIFGG